MRQLAALPNADAAQTLADLLLTQRIETRLEQLPDAWVVWVLDEDRLPQARKELADFAANPTDPRFAAARRTAETERRRAARETEQEATPVVEPPPWAPRPAHLTNGLILVSCLVFAAHTGYLILQNGGLASNGAVSILLLGHTEGQVVLTSPVQQALAIASFVVDRAQDRIGWNGLDDVTHGQVWRLITPIFLHFGLIHLMFNMLMLRQLGAMIEIRRGVWRYLLLVLVSPCRRTSRSITSTSSARTASSFTPTQCSEACPACCTACSAICG